ncbi:MAG: phosphate/phosphite/phosphonate ABC transporter substrate-binding protein, partial [Rhizobiaceae bacterium]
LRVPVEFIPSRTHLSMVRANNRSPVEYAIFSPVAYAAIANMCQCVEPLVTARTNDGSSGFRIAIYTLPEGPGSVSALSGKTIGMIKSDAVGGNDFALYELAADGVEEGENGFEIRSFDKGEEAAEAFLNREIDALMGWTLSGGNGTSGLLPGTGRHLLSRLPEDPGINVIWQSSEIPFRVHAVRTNLPPEAKNALRDLLTGMFSDDPVAYDSIEPVYGGGFFAARPSQFEPLAKMLSEAGITDQRPTDIITPIIKQDEAERAAQESSQADQVEESAEIEESDSEEEGDGS